MYKPREGQLSWFGHRISGLAIFLFLFGHILSTSVIVWGPHGPDMHAKLDAFYRLPIFTLVFHPLLFAAVAFHALNGIRIVIIDWWSKSTGVQRKLFYAEIVLFAALMLTAVRLMIVPEWNAYQNAKAGGVATASAQVQGGIR
ncbi:MAG TPA: succinate dehydrogenase, cytochrome b556 subunit [Armatimonadota bacterium]|jgi:succinate dehydrogenase / fumarate reductase cytochrome b subunit